MKIRFASSAAMLVAAAGLAAAQPTVDGVYDPATEDAFYGDIHWSQTVGTAFGNNAAGDFHAGQTGGLVTLGDPQLVTTGFEVCIPKTALGGATSFDLFSIINNGDRQYPANQMTSTGVLPDDMDNVGGITGWPSTPDYNVDVPGSQFISVTGIPTAAGAIVVDGALDAEYASFYTQTIFTKFGNNDDAAQNQANGSEMDGLYAVQDANNIYIFIAGNIHGGNSIDIWFETGSGGVGTVPAAGTYTNTNPDIQKFLDNQAGVVFETGFAPNYYLTMTELGGAFPVAYADLGGSTILYAGDADWADTTSGGTMTAGDAGAPVLLATFDNSNVAGVPGDPVGTQLPDIPDSPAAPDANWGYGSEIDNIRSYIDTTNNMLYLFIGGNMEVNYNQLELFFDCQPDGQNPMRDDNLNISFDGLNRHAGLIFDTGFESDYWMAIKTGKTGNNSDPLENYTDCTTTRTDGPLVDPFLLFIADWAAFSGGILPDNEVISFDGTYADIPSGGNQIYTDGSPRLTTAAIGIAQADNIFVAIDNSNVGGVGPFGSADTTDPATVNSGVELAIDLDELGWDGVQDILVTGFINANGHDFASNQFLGGLPSGTDNLGDPALLDLTTVAGDQFVNLMATIDPCDAIDFNDDGFINLADVLEFIDLFTASDPGADINGDGFINLADVLDFVSLFQTCTAP